jgi:hypothetical protein
MIPVKNKPHLFRDEHGAIINTDTSELEAYQKRRDEVMRQKAEINQLKVSINNMNSDISEIKQALKTLIENIK